MPEDLELIKIWTDLTWAAGHVGDAMQARKKDPHAPIRADLFHAGQLASTAAAAIQEAIRFDPNK